MTPVGVVLAGGAGRRLGGAKAIAELAGRPLVDRPLAALAAVVGRRAVVARGDTALPALEAGVELWLEPDGRRHPAVGIAHALACAGGAPVLCVAVDLPLLDAATLRRLLAADDGRHACVVPRAAGVLQPLCALWRPEAAEVLAGGGEAPMRALVGALDPLMLHLEDARPFCNVNTPEELAAVAAGLGRPVG